MYNDSSKKAIYKWRDTHKEEWNEYHNNKEKQRYNKNRESILASKKEAYEYKTYLYNNNYKKEVKIYLGILIN